MRDKNRVADFKRSSLRRLAMESLEDRHMLSCSPATATAVAIPSITAGLIPTFGDSECFSITATEGAIYKLHATSDTLLETSIELIDFDANVELGFANSVLDGSARIDWAAPADGTYFLRISGIPDFNLPPLSGDYILDVSQTSFTDDHSNLPIGATSLPVSSTANGSIEVDGDVDYFAFNATGGTRYNLFTTAALTDTRIVLRDTDGARTLSSDDNNGHGGASLIFWTAPVDGTYFIEVGASQGVGDYTLDIEVPVDDHGDFDDDATPIAIPSSTAAAVNFKNDRDFFSFNATAGIVYNFSATQANPSEDCQSDACMELKVHDATRSLKGVNRGDTLYWLAPATGEYYIEVRDEGGNNIDDYTLEASAISYTDDHGNLTTFATPLAMPSTTNGEIEVDGDIDLFSFDATAGTRYNLFTTAEPLFFPRLELLDTDGETLLDLGGSITNGTVSLITWIAPASGTYYAQVRVSQYESVTTGTYTLDVEPAMDDYDDDVSNATSITIPASIDAGIDFRTDTDVFSFDATAGRIYEFTAPPVTPTDLNTKLVIYDTNGTTQLGRGYNSTGIQWLATASGTYYLSVVESNDLTIGDYTLNAIEVTYPDDHGNLINLATPLSLPLRTRGAIEVEADVDFFSFNATEGEIYRFGSQKTLDTDIYPSIRIYGADTVTLLRSTNAFWEAPSSDTFHLGVSASEAGTYTLDAEIPIDDHGDDINSATMINTPATTLGGIDFPTDNDYFTFHATAGTVYNYSVETLNDVGSNPAVRLLEPDGTRVSSARPVDSFSYTWRAQSSGTYYVQVQPGHSSTGQYVLTLSPTTYPDDHGNLATGATPFSIPSTANGEIEVFADADYFSFTATAGVVYNFSASVQQSKLHVFGPDGVTELAYSQLSQSLAWSAPASGTYYLSVEGYPGPYVLNSSANSDYEDDHGNLPTAATLLSLPSTTNSNIEVFGDVDYFAFQAVGGLTYTFSADAQFVSGGFTRLRLFDAVGETLNDGVYNGLDLHWQAPSSGIYYLSVIDFGDDHVGDYVLSGALNTTDLVCDYVGNDDGCNLLDIDALYAGANGASAPLTDDQIMQWLVKASDPANPLKANASDAYVHGDADLDGDVDSIDLGLLLNNFLDTSGRGWGGGNFNSDSVVDSIDLGLQLNNFGFTSTATSAVSMAASQPFPIVDSSSVDAAQSRDETQDGDEVEFAFVQESEDDGEDEDAELIDQVFAAV